MQFTVVKVQAYVDGAMVTAVKDRGDRISFQWERPASRSVRLKAQKRLAVMIRKFDMSHDPAGTRQLSLPNEAP